MKKQLFKVPVGDWSSDGHGQSTDFYVLCSHSLQEMQQAYRDTCKKIGLQLNHNENYTGLDEVNGYGHWRQLLTEYESGEIDYEAVEILKEHGFDFSLTGVNTSDFEEGDGVCFGENAVFHLFMWFISYSLENFEYEEFELEAEAINGYWGDLNHQIGYGVF